MFVYLPYASLVPSDVRASKSKELELQALVNHHFSVGNETKQVVFIAE